MTLKFDYEIFYDKDEDVHNEYCDGYMCSCNVNDLSKKIRFNFTTSCGQNFEYKFDTVVIFFISKYDKKNFKKFIYVMKNIDKVNNIIENSKQKIDQIYANDDSTDLTKNRR